MDNQPINPTPTPAPEPTPAEPVAEAPANEAPVEAPVETPAEPAAEPVAEPVAEPEVPVEAPVEAPAETPVEPETPAEPVAEPAAEVEAPVDAPVEAPAETPAETSAPVESEVPTEAPVEAPASAEPVTEPAAPITEPAAPIEEPAAPAMPEMPGIINPQPVAQAQGVAAPAKKSKTTLILGIILGIVVLAGIGVGAYMLLNNKEAAKPPVTTNTPAPTANIKTVNCVAKGNAWSIEQEVVVDEDKKQTTELGITIKSDASKLTNAGEEITITTDTELDPEQAGVGTVAAMALVFQNSEKIDGITIKDNSDVTAGLIDITYRAIREEIEDEGSLDQFRNNDGKTAEELKKEVEESSADSSASYTCTVE